MRDEPRIERTRVTDEIPPVVVNSATLKMGRSIRRWLQTLTALTIIICLILGGLIGWTWHKSNENTNALCAIYNDSVRRAEAGAKFLTENPKGIPGISVDQIQISINNARATTRSLNSLGCPMPVVETPAPIPTHQKESKP